MCCTQYRLKQRTYTVITHVITALTLVNMNSIVRNKAFKGSKYGNENSHGIQQIFGP